MLQGFSKVSSVVIRLVSVKHLLLVLIYRSYRLYYSFLGASSVFLSRAVLLHICEGSVEFYYALLVLDRW